MFSFNKSHVFSHEKKHNHVNFKRLNKNLNFRLREIV